MGDENSIRTLGDYSKPSHEGYRNTIELPAGNNVATIERMAQYEDEGWSDAITPDEVNLNFENPDIEQLLGVMERKVDALMTDAISLMKKSENVFRLTTNEIYQPPPEPSHQEEFEHIMTNFILDQEERITQLKDYMQVIVDEFMEFSSEVARRLKEKIKENKNKPRKIEKITRYLDTEVLENSAKCDLFKNLEKKTFPTPTNLLCVRHVRIIPSDPPQPRKNTLGFEPGKKANQSHHKPSNFLTIQPLVQSNATFVDQEPIKRDSSPHNSFIHAMSKRARSTRGQAFSSRDETLEEKVRKFGLFDNETHQMNYNNLAGRSIHSEDVVDWEFLSNKGLAQSFFDSINTDPFFGTQWANLFQINEPIFHKLARSLPHLSLMPPLAGMTPYTRVSQLGWEERKGKFPFLNLDRGLVNTPKGNLEMLQHLVV
ncbi:hypothetical protein Tco_0703107 [Tanacetum coccineum]|uniref:Uncharacterized protein n=1 Tax=Tanacetum coccineum TaxID=301880 RepID=A0ABQ4XYQ7_9ASTR